MSLEVQVYEIRPDAKSAELPRAVRSFVVDGATLDDARRAALERLRADGHVLRSLSCISGGALAAVVFSPAPAVPSAASVRSALRGVQ